MTPPRLRSSGLPAGGVLGASTPTQHGAVQRAAGSRLCPGAAGRDGEGRAAPAQVVWWLHEAPAPHCPPMKDGHSPPRPAAGCWHRARCRQRLKGAATRWGGPGAAARGAARLCCRRAGLAAVRPVSRCGQGLSTAAGALLARPLAPMAPSPPGNCWGLAGGRSCETPVPVAGAASSSSSCPNPAGLTDVGGMQAVVSAPPPRFPGRWLWFPSICARHSELSRYQQQGQASTHIAMAARPRCPGAGARETAVLQLVPRAARAGRCRGLLFSLPAARAGHLGAARPPRGAAVPGTCPVLSKGHRQGRSCWAPSSHPALPAPPRRVSLLPPHGAVPARPRPRPSAPVWLGSLSRGPRATVVPLGGDTLRGAGVIFEHRSWNSAGWGLCRGIHGALPHCAPACSPLCHRHGVGAFTQDSAPLLCSCLVFLRPHARAELPPSCTAVET